LLLSEKKTNFSIWHTEIEMTKAEDDPILELTQHGNTVEVTLKGFPKSSSQASLDHVDLWEIDWDYNDKIFRSQSQHVRGWRDKEIQSTLTHTYTQPGIYKIGVRIANSVGEYKLISKQISL
jgi:PKD repeat protein